MVRRLVRDIRRGRVVAAMMAPAYASFSRARDRVKAIRSSRFPWGIPQRFLSCAERDSVQQSNACFRTCILLIEELNRAKVPWILQHPWSSRCWSLPPLRNLLRSGQAFFSTGDSCQWGTKWRRPLGFLHNHVCDAHRLSRPCQGPRGCCSRTGHSHWLLPRSSPDGPPKAQLEPFSRKLGKDLAHVLTSGYHAARFF